MNEEPIVDVEAIMQEIRAEILAQRAGGSGAEPIVATGGERFSPAFYEHLYQAGLVYDQIKPEIQRLGGVRKLRFKGGGFAPKGRPGTYGIYIAPVIPDTPAGERLAHVEHLVLPDPGHPREEVRAVLLEVVAVQQAVEYCAHGASCRMKLAISRSPSGVSTLSG